MIWLSKYPKHPQTGDIVNFKRFALFPVRLDDNYTVWLESYWVERRYERQLDVLITGYATHVYRWQTYAKTRSL